MGKATKEALGPKINKGLIITKYGHSMGEIEGFQIIEAGHPIPDINSLKGSTIALDMVKKLTDKDQIIFLISGGGSSLFELPMPGINLEDIIDITNQLIRCGADIIEINTIRKRLSQLKGGKFAEYCKNTNIYSIVLSDVVGDRLDSIASGPAYPDITSSSEAIYILEKYNLKTNKNIIEAIKIETPKKIGNVETKVIGSVTNLCNAALRNSEKLGYRSILLTTTLDCEAKEAGKFLASIARESEYKNNNLKKRIPRAWIVGGETVVNLLGDGKGGRNQEVALSAAINIEDLKNVIIFSLGSDGTDGPTDAAGGMVDGETVFRIKSKKGDPNKFLNNNDSYHALKLSEDLIMTGPTGTNLNDLIMILCR